MQLWLDELEHNVVRQQRWRRVSSSSRIGAVTGLTTGFHDLFRTAPKRGSSLDLASEEVPHADGGDVEALEQSLTLGPFPGALFRQHEEGGGGTYGRAKDDHAELLWLEHGCEGASEWSAGQARPQLRGGAGREEGGHDGSGRRKEGESIRWGARFHSRADMVAATPDNANPVVHSQTGTRRARRTDELDFSDDDLWARAGEAQLEHPVEQIDEDEIFGARAAVDVADWPDLIRSISDPEHPLTLEQLAVVSAAQITVSNGPRPHVLVEFTPTIPHCSMATLIGACDPLWPC